MREQREGRWDRHLNMKALIQEEIGALEVSVDDWWVV
jgi:hypothetical protein